MNKKILAILMALLMVLMSSVAFAADYTAGADTLTIEKNYILTNATGISPEETFDFEIAAQGNYPAITISDVTFAEGAATTDGAVANITLNIPAATAYGTPGEYLYTITEADSPNQGVTTLNGKKMELKVTILTEANGTLVRVYSFKEDGAKVQEVTNEYSAGDLTIDKTVEGLMADRTELFDVTVVLTATEKIYADLITVPAGATATQTDDNTVTITDLAVSHNVDAVIEGIPYGTAFEVIENMTDDQKEIYNEEASTTTDNGTVEAATQTAELNNIAIETEIDTGVNTDNMPYIMLMAFVMMLAAAVVLKKRTVND